MKPQKFAWDTNHEIAFLNRLGTWSPNTRIRNKTKPELVNEYLNACRKRVNWGDIDRNRIENHCLTMIVGRTT